MAESRMVVVDGVVDGFLRLRLSACPIGAILALLSFN